MIQRLAANITDFFIHKNIVAEENKEVYTYGFDLILSGLVNILLVLLSGIILDSVWQAMLYVLIMVQVRMFTGGYHADTHSMCNIIFVFCFIFSVLALDLVSYFQITWIIWFLVCIGLISVNTYAPLENRNKKLSAEQKKRYKKISVVLYVGYVFISGAINVMSRFQSGMLHVRLENISSYINIILIIIAGLLMVGLRKEGKCYDR